MRNNTYRDIDRKVMQREICLQKTIALCYSQHTCWEYIQNINFLQILVRPK